MTNQIMLSIIMFEDVSAFPRELELSAMLTVEQIYFRLCDLFHRVHVSSTFQWGIYEKY